VQCDLPAKVWFPGEEGLCAPEIQSARNLGDAGRRILDQNCYKDAPKFAALDPWLRLTLNPVPVNLAAKLVRTSPFRRHSLKQLNEWKLELVRQATKMVKGGPDSAGSPSLEHT
jgi:hypothetical protein